VAPEDGFGGLVRKGEEVAVLLVHRSHHRELLARVDQRRNKDPDVRWDVARSPKTEVERAEGETEGDATEKGDGQDKAASAAAGEGGIPEEREGPGRFEADECSTFAGSPTQQMVQQGNGKCTLLVVPRGQMSRMSCVGTAQIPTSLAYALATQGPFMAILLRALTERALATVARTSLAQMLREHRAAMREGGKGRTYDVLRKVFGPSLPLEHRKEEAAVGTSPPVVAAARGGRHGKRKRGSGRRKGRRK